MRILITNIVALNVGDAAILQGEIKILKKTFGEDVEIIVFDSSPEAAKKYYPEISFRRWIYSSATATVRKRVLKNIIRSLNKTRFSIGEYGFFKGFNIISRTFLSEEERISLDLYKNSDLVVSTGGTYLVENYSLEPRVFDYNLCMKYKIPLMFFTQSLGPFHNPQNKINMNKIIPYSLLVLLRDHKSKQNLKGIGIKDSNLFVTADAAFALADKELVQKEQKNTKHIKKPKIAISVREWKHFKSISPDLGIQNYKKSIKEACVHLIEKYEGEITFISTCQGVKEYWTDDSKFADEIKNIIPEKYWNSVTIDTQFRSPEKLASTLKMFDFVISTRLHMAILSLGVGTPVLPIAYEFKTKELFTNIGQQNFVHDIEDIIPNEFVKNLDDFILALPEIRGKVFKEVEKEIERAIDTSQIIRRKYKIE